MSRNASPTNDTPGLAATRVRRPRIPWGSLAVAGLIAFGFWLWISPVYSFHPTCTYTVNARITADIEVDGEKLSATVVHQNSRSRGWISIMNSAGCKQRYGNALTFKLKDDRVLILPSRLCYRGQKAFPSSGDFDVLRACAGKNDGPDTAFMVDSATRPARWQVVTNGSDYRIIRMTATSTWSNPTDDIASIAPNLLKSEFKPDPQRSWTRSPEPLINWHRRYNRSLAPNGFEFEVRNESF